MEHNNTAYIVSVLEYQEDEDPATIVDKLNHEDRFLDFGEGLKQLIQKRMPEDCKQDEKTYLLKLAEKKNLPLNRNTVVNWLNGGRPKKGENYRENMYKIAFILDLDVEAVQDLFINIYLDRPFYMRNEVEAVYYFCFKNGFDYEHAQMLCGRIASLRDELGEMNSGTIGTRVLGDYIEDLENDDEIVEFVFSNSHSFRVKNRAAREVIHSLLNEIRVRREEKEVIKAGKDCDKSFSIMAQEIARICGTQLMRDTKDERRASLAEIFGNKDLSSIDTMLEWINRGYLSPGQTDTQHRESFFKNMNLPKEIRSRFPQKQIFSTFLRNPNELTAEEIRKMLILLASYKFWFAVEYSSNHLGNRDNRLAEYRELLNAYLYDVCLPPLYAGNPYDWLFLRCSLEEKPLIMFRDIMDEAMPDME